MRILVVSDIHGNLHALRAVLNAARGWDEVIVLGDLVDYGPHPAEVIDSVRELGAKVVRGNHDHAVAYGVDCRCGEEVRWLSVWFRENVTLKLVSRNDIDYLRKLPLMEELGLGSSRAYAVHGSPRNPLYGYLYPWLNPDEACSMLRRPSMRLRPSGDNRECPKGLYLVGHTHHQFYRIVYGAIVVNPGSVGQPRDGDPRAAFAIIDADRQSIELYRVEYDFEKTIRDLEKLGVGEPYMAALRYMLSTGRVY
ncbi:MAG: metallophosphoesterase family protein, partial [Thermoproteota archaeon]